MSEGPGTDLRWTVIATYSPTTPPAVDAVATGSCLMIPSVMPDSREPVPTSSGFAITRRGGPRNVAATRAAGEEGCRVQAFEDADAAPRAPNRARVITSYQKVEAAPPSAHGDSHRPHCKSVTVAQPPGRGLIDNSPSKWKHLKSVSRRHDGPRCASWAL